MATPTTRAAFKAYCLRRLGAPVINIDVDDAQVEDRIDDALAKFRDYHYDGSERTLLAYQITATDITNQYITMPESIFGVVKILDGGGTGSVDSLFNVQYQIRLNDFFNISSGGLTPYVIAMRYMETMEEIFEGKTAIRYERHTDKLKLDWDWTTVEAGNYVIIDCYRVIDPEEYTDVWNDIWLKRYVTALVKRQWGMNLKKFTGMQLPGGVAFDGQTLYQEAVDEIETLEQELIDNYSLPPEMMAG